MGWCFAAREKGPSQAMSTGNESSMISCTNGQTKTIPVGYAASESSFSRRLFRPWAIGFIGLAISVALWGYGYKISRYNPHPDASSRTLLAKMWDKHQDVTQVSDATKACSQPQPRLELHAAILLLGQPPTLAERVCHESDESKRIPALLRSIVPLRSPPSNNLSA